jgi:cytochrome c biogenesis protein CcmG/thiol:disulfide interchange protein DsbE
MKKLIPLIIFIVIAVFLFLSLNSNKGELPSPLLGKMFPSIEGKDFYTNETIKVVDLLDNKMTLVNVWASWCTTCRKEHQMIMNIAQNTDLRLIGIDYKDTRANGAQYLEIMGNPFDEILFDPDGKIGMDLGVYATPETFLVDKKGMILYKHIGEINQNVWDKNFAVHLNPIES